VLDRRREALPRWLASSFSLLALASIARTSGALEIQELAERVRPSVVLLTVKTIGGEASGTGFVISQDGKIVTNHHVVAGAKSATATFSNGTSVPVVGRLADDPEADLAILAIAGKSFPPLVLGESGTLKIGDEVLVIGSPLGLSASLSIGIVAARRAEGVSKERGFDGEGASWQLQITAPISPGSSGSPVLTRDGRVVGVAVGKARGESLNFAIPVELANRLSTGIAAGAVPTPFGDVDSRSVRTNLLISAVVFAGVGALFVVGSWIDRWLRKRKSIERRGELS
jgi:putative serine protease PepD